MTAATYGLWPTPTQKLLLQASLLRDADARSAFAAWEARVDLDRLDNASIRLLPLLYHNLVACGMSERTPLIGRLRGIYRQTWYKNQLLLGALGELLAHLSHADVPTLVLKGAPLALGYYPTVGARPMLDGDVLIPERCGSIAVETVLRAGLTPRFPSDVWPSRVKASTHFLHPDGWELDLQIRLDHCSDPVANDDLWRAAVPLAVNAVPTLTLAPEDHVLHVLGHGVRRNKISPIRWVADVAMVLDRHRAFDWSRLQEQARRCRMSLLVRTALRYLRDNFRLDVPVSVMADLEREPIGITERFELQSRLVPGAAGIAAGTISDYVRARRRERDWQGPFGFVRYLRDRHRLASSWQVAVAIGWKVARGGRRRSQANRRD